MRKVVYRAENRGYTKSDWLDSYHTFSFGGFYDPNRTNFGTLRVLNDDYVQPGRGFNLHPHGDIEIITVPLKGTLQHRDSQGNIENIKEGDIQVITAGNGIEHSEFNASDTDEVNFLQIWIDPQKKALEPQYDVMKFPFNRVNNDFLPIVVPNGDDSSLYINQNAWMTYGNYKKDETAVYELNEQENGVYIFVIEGEVNVDGDILKRRDGLGMEKLSDVPMVFEKESSFIIFEIPMV